MTRLATVPERWEELVRQARLHGVAGRLAHACGDHLPAARKGWRRGVIASHVAGHDHRWRETMGVRSTLQADGIRCVPLKGPVFAERVLSPPWVKASGDLDVLVDEADLDRACRCLTRAGAFQRVPSRVPWWIERREVHEAHLAPGPANPNGSPVELHFRLQWQDPPISGTDFLDRSEVWTARDGRPVPVLNRVDEALFLAIHASRHFFSRIAWLYEALALYRTLSSDELARVVALARRGGQIRRLEAASRATEEFLQEPLVPGLATARRFRDIRAASLRLSSGIQPFCTEEAWRRRRVRRSTLVRWNHCRMAGSRRDLGNVTATYVVSPLLRRAYLLAGGRAR